MAGNHYLDRFACVSTSFRWVLVYINLVVISLAIRVNPVIRYFIIGVTGTALVFNVAIGIADKKAKGRIPEENDVQIPRYPVITCDFVFATLYIAFWAWMMQYRLFVLTQYGWIAICEDPSYSENGDPTGCYRLNILLFAYLLVGIMVIWHFHLIFAVVGVIRRQRIDRIVKARRLGPTSVATDD